MQQPTGESPTRTFAIDGCQVSIYEPTCTLDETSRDSSTPARAQAEAHPAGSDALAKRHASIPECPTPPIVYLHVFDGDGSDVLRECRLLGCQKFTLVAIHPHTWNDDMTPWECPGLFADDAPFAGKALRQLELLERKIIPQVEAEAPRTPGQRMLAGYSLAGLFATWAAFNSTAFGRIASASGSLWYPGLTDYIASRPFACMPACAYFSLGSKEARTPSRLLRNVAQATHSTVKTFQAKGVPTIFEQNPGNHFKDPALRTAKAIVWTLKQS